MVKKQKAIGEEDVNARANDEQIARVLAAKGERRIGWGRVVTTVGSLEEIKKMLGHGYEILWCQMSKTVVSEGEKNG